MTELTQITDRIARTQRGLLRQFRGQPNLEAIMASHGVQYQELENVFFQLYTIRWLSSATGQQLDNLGIIVGEPRQGRDDENYRAALYARVAINKGNATIEDILFAMDFAKPDEYELRELGDATLSVRLVTAIGSMIDPETLNAALQGVKGAGVEARFIYSEYADSSTFKWASGATREVDVNQGWADTAKTQGGFRADVAT